VSSPSSPQDDSRPLPTDTFQGIPVVGVYTASDVDDMVRAVAPIARNSIFPDPSMTPFPKTALPLVALLLLSGCVVLAGCDTFYTLVLTAPTDTDAASDSTLVLDHRCGRVSVQLQVWQGTAYDFYQRFAPTDTLTLYADSMVVTYDGQRRPVRFVPGGGVDAGTIADDGRTFTVKREGLVRTAFQIDERLAAGDTIRVRTDGYAYCEGAPVELGPWTAVAPVDLLGPFEAFSLF
jgi:hypothetical protein